MSIYRPPKDNFEYLARDPFTHEYLSRDSIIDAATVFVRGNPRISCTYLKKFMECMIEHFENTSGSL